MSRRFIVNTPGGFFAGREYYEDKPEEDTMTAQGHTPTPWKVLDKMNASGDCIIVSEKVNAYGNFHIAEVSRGNNPLTGEDKANAAFICRAVNHHAELIEALKACYKTISEGSYHNSPSADKARAVLAKVEQ